MTHSACTKLAITMNPFIPNQSALVWQPLALHLIKNITVINYIMGRQYGLLRRGFRHPVVPLDCMMSADTIPVQLSAATGSRTGGRTCQFLCRTYGVCGVDCRFVDTCVAVGGAPCAREGRGARRVAQRWRLRPAFLHGPNVRDPIGTELRRCA